MLKDGRVSKLWEGLTYKTMIEKLVSGGEFVLVIKLCRCAINGILSKPFSSI